MSVEMFEQMRNWTELLRRMSDRLTPDGKAFIHVFSHRSLAYRFEGTWAAERFFTGRTMPSHDLLLRFQERPRRRGALGGVRNPLLQNLRAWLERLDANSARATAILEKLGVDVRPGGSLPPGVCS